MQESRCTTSLLGIFFFSSEKHSLIKNIFFFPPQRSPVDGGFKFERVRGLQLLLQSPRWSVPAAASPLQTSSMHHKGRKAMPFNREMLDFVLKLLTEMRKRAMSTRDTPLYRLAGWDSGVGLLLVFYNAPCCPSCCLHCLLTIPPSGFIT